MKADTDVDEYVPFYFENDEVKTKEDLKREKQEKQAGEAYFNYDFDSGEEDDIDDSPSHTGK